MKEKLRRRLAFLLAAAIVFMNLFPLTNSEGEVIMTPLSGKVLAAGSTGASSPSTTITTEGKDYTFYMVNNSTQIEKGEGIEITGEGIQIGIDCDAGNMPAGATIEWQVYDTNIISYTEVNKYKISVSAVSPGYSMLTAIIKLKDGSYSQVYCQFHVPLSISSSNKSYTSEKYGYDNRQTNDTSANKTLQLSADPKSPYQSYLMKLDHVKYKAGVENIGSSINANTKASDILDTNGAMSLAWTTSNPNVVTVNDCGVVTAVGAGYAEVTVTTITTSEKGKAESKTFPVIVAPRAYDEANKTWIGDHTIEAKESTVTIKTNGLGAKNLTYVLRKGDENGQILDIDKNDYMTVNISEFSGNVTLSNLKAGVYYLNIRPTSKFAENNSNVVDLTIKIIVPVRMSLDPAIITMNVDDTYNLLSVFNFASSDSLIYNTGGSLSNIVTYNKGTVTAVESGTDVLKFTYDPSLFQGVTSNLIKDTEFPITFRVIDKLAISMTNATMYVGSTLQLQLVASDLYTSVDWSSSNESVATVDEYGLVTGLKAGNTVITAKQTINGVVKKVTCKITVKKTITKIELSPSSKAIAVGDNLTINATVTPDANGASLKWITSDANVVKIVEQGNLSTTVQGVAGGTAVITAINMDNVVVGSCTVTVYESIMSIKLSESAITVPLSSKFFYLYATISPEAASSQEVIWSSSNPSILTVDQNGKVTLKKPGTATVIVTSRIDATITAMCTVTVTKAVTGIALDTTAKEMYAGESYRLTYQVKPSDASNAAVTWTSTNTNVATVNATGLVTAKNPGSTAIILKTADGGYMSICLITVKKVATGVTLDAKDITLNVGDYYTLETTITPSDATESSLTFESTNKKVATVSNSGKIVAKAGGTCVIFVKTPNGASAYVNVTVMQGVSGIKINKSEATIVVGDTLELIATISPSTATDQGVTWSSSKKDVATVDKYGVVKGISGGTTIITCTSDDGNFIAHCILTVEEFVTEITLDKSYYKLGIGRTYNLVATISGEKATNKTVTWKSSNPKVVTVDKNGKIKGIALGTATITVKANDGSGAEASCVVRVCKLVTGIDLDVTYITLVQGKSHTIKATVSPASATYKTPLWSTDNSDVAIVNKKGTVTALSPGNAIITAKANDTSGVSSLCYVKVIAPVASTSVSLAESEIIMSAGETKTVGVSIIPTNSTDSYTWSSDNTLVASVNATTGKITAKALGTANITVMTESGRKGTVKVYVVGLSRTSVTLEQYTSLLLSLEVDGTGSDNIKVRWDVENQEIATVANGKVTAKAVGTTYVYAVVNGRKLACKVTVTKIK
ncbi:MAG: hypothetical protein E7256_14610 [Lachnospiraceae bacterium]|nr:hypothetical protein [Lachnospiraceae bacterium]